MVRLLEAKRGRQSIGGTDMLRWLKSKLSKLTGKDAHPLPEGVHHSGQSILFRNKCRAERIISTKACSNERGSSHNYASFRVETPTAADRDTVRYLCRDCAEVFIQKRFGIDLCAVVEIIERREHDSMRPG